MSVDPIRERIEQRIADEDRALERVVAFVEGGVLAARISPEHADLIIAAAQRAHDGSVALLRALLGEEE